MSESNEFSDLLGDLMPSVEEMEQMSSAYLNQQNLPAERDVSEVPAKAEESDQKNTISPEAEADLVKVRDTLTKLIDSGMDSIHDLGKVAQSSDHPRAYEALAVLMKTIAETGKELIEIHKSTKELKENKATKADGATGINVEKAVFVGSTQELEELLNGGAKK